MRCRALLTILSLIFCAGLIRADSARPLNYGTLIIANAAYPGGLELSGALRSGQELKTAVESRSRREGLNEVTFLTNLKLAQMKEAIDTFTKNTHYDVRLIYFVGLSWQFNGGDYILPVDFATRDERQLPARSYRAIQAFPKIGGSLKLVLDTGRDDRLAAWFGKPAKNPWLTPIKPPGDFNGVAISFGQTDGSDRSSLFARSMIDCLGNGSDSLNEIKSAVEKESHGAQLPYVQVNSPPRISVSTIPAGARAVLDGRTCATPCLLEGATGDNELKLSLRGYENETRHFVLATSTTVKVAPIPLREVKASAASSLPVTSADRGTIKPVAVPARFSSEGKRYALVIGIDKYAKPIPPLTTAVNDAKAVAAELKQFDFTEIKLLSDKDATRKGIKDALNLYVHTLSTSDSLLVYYAGHGSRDDAVGTTYWLPSDAGASDTNYVSADEITRSLRGMAARHVLIVSDSCYSGTLKETRDPGIRSRSPMPEDRAALENIAKHKSRHLLASGGNEPVLDRGGDGSHSIFATVFLDSLRNMSAEMFTGNELSLKVRERVAGRSAQLPEYDFLPNSGHDGGDFIFRRQAARP